MVLTVSQLCSSLASQSSKTSFPDTMIDLNRKGDTGFFRALDCAPPEQVS